MRGDNKERVYKSGNRAERFVAVLLSELWECVTDHKETHEYMMCIRVKILFGNEKLMTVNVDEPQRRGDVSGWN